VGQLDGRIACVTGGTRGIGRAAAEAFLREGAKVVVTGRSSEKGQRALDEIDAGDNVHFISGDVKRREDCEALIQGTVDRYGRIDILFANAGGVNNSSFVPVAEMSDEGMEDTLIWNFWHTFWTMRAALNHMIPQQHGRIIATSSVQGKVGKPGNSSYVVAKHAINGLVKAAAHEVGTLGITVNSVCPGLIETDIIKENGPDYAESMGMTYEELLDWFGKESAIQRINEVEDVAEVCVLLASDVAAGITGSLLSIDGGTSPY